VWSLAIERQVYGDVVVFSSNGRLGTLTSGELIEALMAAIRSGEHRLVLDLEQTDYVSSAGLLAIDAVIGRLHQAGGMLVLCNLPEPVRLACDLAGLLDHFDVESSRELAVARVSGRVAE
jgi:anti-sigma B factor antagonist